jgi:transcription elongation GreA/GreB family factor
MKQRLWKYCFDSVGARMAEINAQLNELRAGAESEGKSSAGDKHETGRAMMHLEQEQLQKQLGEFQAQIQQLLSIRQHDATPHVHAGSLVTTEKGTFYIAIGLGKINFENENIFVISPASPLAKAFLGKKLHDTLTFGVVNYKVEKIN